MDKHWYVLRSKPRKEQALCKYARAQGHKIFYPTIPVKPVNPRASKILPYFPGYMFVHADLQNLGRSAFHWMPFSQGLVHVGGEAARVDVNVVRALHKRVGEIWQAGGLIFDGLEQGDRVRIRAGAFSGYEALFDTRLQGGERVRVLLQMLNDRYVSLELSASDIERERM